MLKEEVLALEYDQYHSKRHYAGNHQVLEHGDREGVRGNLGESQILRHHLDS